LAILSRSREHCLALDGGAGMHPVTGVAGHLLVPVNPVLQRFLPCPIRPTWAYPARYHRLWLLRSSQCCACFPALRLG
jgi:hypothetical protein